MAARPAIGRRTRIVRLLRIGFPLVAIGLLASIFLSGEAPITDDTLTFSESDLEAMRGGMQITSPQLSGASSRGDIYDFKASVVRPSSLNFELADITDLVGTINYVAGPTVFVASKSAQVNLASRQMTLETGIVLRTSNGYAANADRVEVDGPAARLVATGNVVADGPVGHIEAGRLIITPPENSETPRFGEASVLRFEDGVRLTYNPAAIDSVDETRP